MKSNFKNLQDHRSTRTVKKDRSRVGSCEVTNWKYAMERGKLRKGFGSGLAEINFTINKCNSTT